MSARGWIGLSILAGCLFGVGFLAGREIEHRAGAQERLDEYARGQADAVLLAERRSQAVFDSLVRAAGGRDVFYEDSTGRRVLWSVVPRRGASSQVRELP